MEKINLLCAFGVALIFFSSSSALDFGFCETTIQHVFVTNLSTPYYLNKTIRGCCKGFIKVGNRCEPECRNVNCANGRCIGNNMCDCDAGYYFNTTQGKCRPLCNPACISPNAACQYPNVCECRPRYRKANSTYCEPICSFTDEEFECINAYCIAPNKCQCHEGFEAVSPFQCEPICQNCTNGQCVAPGECECYQDYEKNEEGICVPVCTPSCINGWCQAPDECVCYENYQKYLNHYECLELFAIQNRQDCQRLCVNGGCSGNGTCMCDYGHELYNGKCLKICNKNCGHGKCLENQCVCPPHYRLENSTCVPICAFEDDHDCINGDCIGPNICRCHDGFRFLDNRNCTCVPMCVPACINGICTEDGCICYDGFYNMSDFECGKNCSEGFVWLVDECIEEGDFDLFKDESSIRAVTDEDFFGETLYDDGFGFNVLSTSSESSVEIFSTTDNKIVEVVSDQSNEEIFMEEEKELIFTTLVVVLSVIIILLISILITFYVLYQHIFPKHIYFVQQKEMSSNCVYFSKPKNGQLPVTEFNI